MHLFVLVKFVQTHVKLTAVTNFLDQQMGALEHKILNDLVLQNADCVPKYTRHVDSFLFDNDLLHELTAQGRIESHYCVECGSTKTKSLSKESFPQFYIMIIQLTCGPSSDDLYFAAFISHSASRAQIAYMYNVLLPPIEEDKVLLDVGSRLGPILYGVRIFCLNLFP